jgi:hypothetical protein
MLVKVVFSGLSKAEAVVIQVIAKREISLLIVGRRIIAAFKTRVMFLEQCVDSSIKLKVEEKNKKTCKIEMCY